MSDEQREYYLRRAQTSLAQAHAAHDPAIAAIHQDLHKRYLTLADSLQTPRSRVLPASDSVGVADAIGLAS